MILDHWLAAHPLVLTIIYVAAILAALKGERQDG
jgi:hypothetical protein